MSDINSSPVTLPAGSYDHDALKSGLDKAAKGSAKNYDQAVVQAVAGAAAGSADGDAPVSDGALEPGYVKKDVENVLGGVESIQVFSPKVAAKIDEDPAPTVAIVPTTPAATAAESNPQE